MAQSCQPCIPLLACCWPRKLALHHKLFLSVLSTHLQAVGQACYRLQVEILAEGDHVNELMVVVSGLVEVQKPSEWMGQAGEEESIRLDINSKSIHGGRTGIELGTRWAANASVIDIANAIFAGILYRSPKQGKWTHTLRSLSHDAP